MTEFPLNEVIAALVTLISLIYAWWKNKQVQAVTNFYSIPTAAPTVSGNALITAGSIPMKSWTMSESTRKWVLYGEDETDKASINAQINTAEASGQTTYTIHYSKGYYIIEYGLIKSSGRDKK